MKLTIIILFIGICGYSQDPDGNIYGTYFYDETLEVAQLTRGSITFEADYVVFDRYNPLSTFCTVPLYPDTITYYWYKSNNFSRPGEVNAWVPLAETGENHLTIPREQVWRAYRVDVEARGGGWTTWGDAGWLGTGHQSGIVEVGPYYTLQIRSGGYFQIKDREILEIKKH